MNEQNGEIEGGSVSEKMSHLLETDQEKIRQNTLECKLRTDSVKGACARGYGFIQCMYDLQGSTKVRFKMS